MSEIKRGPLKGKNITYAATDRMNDYRQLANDFMMEVFDLLPGDYLITDESSLHDFADFGVGNTSPIWSRIMESYAVSRTDVPSEKLVDILAQIRQRRRLQ